MKRQRQQTKEEEEDIRFEIQHFWSCFSVCVGGGGGGGGGHCCLFLLLFLCIMGMECFQGQYTNNCTLHISTHANVDIVD